MIENELAYIKEIWAREEKFKNQSFKDREQKTTSSNSRFAPLRLVVQSLLTILSAIDFVLLVLYLFSISFLRRDKINLLYVAKNFCIVNQGKLELRISRELFAENTIFINTSKEDFIRKIGNAKVYNIGFLIAFMAFLSSDKDRISCLYKSYKSINNFVLSFRKSIEAVYFYWFYDLNSLALIFSENRTFHEFVEIQHGSIINYPPYKFPAPIKIADVFYVRNNMTVSYLKQNLCRDFDCEYRLLEYPQPDRKIVSGINLLYASTIEFKGFHPVFKKFLQEFKDASPSDKINLSIRLHPRERGCEDLFLKDLINSGVDFKFDNSENWLLSNSIEGLIVVSPWSSTLEEAFDNGYSSITIDQVGRERFSHFISEGNFLYSDNLIKTLSTWDYRIR